MLLADIPPRNAGLYPDKTAIVQGNVRFTFAQFDERTNRLANAVMTLGATKGDRIAILSGLDAGDRVAVSGLDQLSDGVPVGPVK